MLTRYVDSMIKHNSPGGMRSASSGYDLFDFPHFFENFNNDKARTTQNHRCEANDNEMIASFDLPGVKPGDVEASVTDKCLTISYTLRGKKQIQKYAIRNDYDASAAHARLEHGVLEVRFPKIALAKGKKIDIEVK